MLVASILSEITDGITSAIGDYGLYAVFLLMFVDAVLPAASEVVMVYAGAVASGAFAGQDVVFFGTDDRRGASLPTSRWRWQGRSGTRSARSWAGRSGSTAAARTSSATVAGSIWTRSKLDRAERWFERWEDLAVFLGRLTPVVRSFVSIPAGVMEVPFVRYTLLTLAGSAIWCFAFAGAGYAVGENWEDFHHAFRYVEYLVAAAVVAAIAVLARRAIRQGGGDGVWPRSRRPGEGLTRG